MKKLRISVIMALLLLASLYICKVQEVQAKTSYVTFAEKALAFQNNSTIKAPTGIKATNSNGKIVIVWNKVNGVDGYNLYYKVGNGQWKSSGNITIIGNMATLNVSSNKDYVSVKLKSVKNNKESSFSQVLVIKLRTIKSISDIKVTKKLNDSFILPKTVKALMSNGTYTDVAVVWSDSKVDTSVSGEFYYYGDVDGYNGTVHLILTVPASEKSVLKPKAPTGLKVWVSDSAQMELQWDNVDNVDGYHIYYSYDQKDWLFWDNDDNTKKLVQWDNDYSAVLNKIEAGKTLYFRVASVKNSVESDYSSIVSCAMVVKPKAPTGLKVWVSDSAQMELQWDNVDNVDGYHIYYSYDQKDWLFWDNDDNTKKLVQWDNDYSAVLNKIEAGKTLYFRVASVKNSVESDYSSIVSCAMVVKPKAPTGLKVWVSDTSQMSLQWDQVDGVDGYHAYYSSDQKNWNYWKNDDKTIKLLQWDNDYSASLSSIEAGKTLYYRIVSVKDGVESDYSNIVSCAMVVKPKTPTGLKVWVSDNTTMSLQWDQVDGVDGYHAYYSTDMKNWNGFLDTDKKIQLFTWASDCSASLGGITAGTTVYYRVVAVKNGVESDYSNIVSCTIGAQPKAPTGLKVWVAKSDTMYLQWDQVDGVDGYHAYYSIDMKNWNGFLDADKKIRLLTWTSDYSTSLSAIPAGTTVYYRVVAVKNGVESDYSNISSCIMVGP